MPRSAARSLFVALCFARAVASGQEVSPAADPAALAPVRVFVMLGQSNMLGFGDVGPVDRPGTLEHLRAEGKLGPPLLDAEGRFAERDDVRYVHLMQKGAECVVVRDEWLAPHGTFGPELGFGQVVGGAFDEPVLLLKACIGNRSLGWDYLPPGSERFEFEGSSYAGYRESPLSWPAGTEPVPIAWYAGKQYDDDVANAKRWLEHFAEHCPGMEGRTAEVAGFVWWQGHKDQNPAHASRYEQNLVRLIEALREDFAAPDAKFVLATIAFGGEALSGPGLTIAEAQLAVDGATGKYPQFSGNVKAVDARPFWRSAEVSPNSRQDYHYFHNAETYYEVGVALGRAMVELLR